jgi:hypothetical protein
MTLLSQNGWPASADRDEIHVKNYEVAGTSRHLACTADVAAILCAFAAKFHKLVEPIDAGVFDEWGHALRNVRGAIGTVSNHGSGTAMDLNASKHPLGKENTFKPEQVVKIHALCKEFGLRWGGDYKTRKDDMHFEIVENRAQVKARVKAMKLPTPKVH